jgi:hypothetical protein
MHLQHEWYNNNNNNNKAFKSQINWDGIEIKPNPKGIEHRRKKNGIMLSYETGKKTKYAYIMHH